MLLRADEVAKLLAFGRSKTYELMASGQLPVVRVGRAVRVPRAALDEWVRAHIENAVEVNGAGKV
jgi:excisionase family DNA binding protein